MPKKKIPSTEITGDLKPRLSLYEMVGLNVNPYNQRTLEEYQAYLDTLSFIELHEHAAQEAGVVPIDDREKLLERLSRQFIVVNGQLEANAIQVKESREQLEASKKKSKLSPEKQRQLKEILARGR